MDIALDLGSCNTRVFVPEKGIVLDEPSVITYDIFDKDIVAAGKEAYKTIGKTPTKRGFAHYYNHLYNNQ